MKIPGESFVYNTTIQKLISFFAFLLISIDITQPVVIF